VLRGRGRRDRGRRVGYGGMGFLKCPGKKTYMREGRRGEDLDVHKLGQCRLVIHQMRSRNILDR